MQFSLIINISILFYLYKNPFKFFKMKNIYKYIFFFLIHLF